MFISWSELEAMAEHLTLSVSEVREQYEVQWSAEWACWLIDATDGSGCTLLDGKSGCRVHAVKPSQCAAFPFWPELLEDQTVWEKSKRFCPGLDAPKGRLYTKREIERIRDGGEPGDLGENR